LEKKSSNGRSDDVSDIEDSSADAAVGVENVSESGHSFDEKFLLKIWDDENPKIDARTRKSKTISFSLEEVQKLASNKKVETEVEKEKFRRFMAKISPNENENAEQELRKEFRKEDFKSMKIFGQVSGGNLSIGGTAFCNCCCFLLIFVVSFA
jgi:hypothetical protein